MLPSGAEAVAVKTAPSKDFFNLENISCWSLAFLAFSANSFSKLFSCDLTIIE